MVVGVVSYGLGNVQSVVAALQRIGVQPEVLHSGDELIAAAPDRIIMPGVGAVGAALHQLKATGLKSALNHLVIEERRPFLGICVGMQVLACTCEEFGSHEGLGWIEGSVGRLESQDRRLRLPHIGWNNIVVRKKGSPVADLDGTDFYFLHSYALRCPAECVAATADYGGSFVAAVSQGHIHGVQFHPEKSDVAGGRLLKQFLSLPC
ncbi:imidazole glycerol phosphate synthase subunit HisH [Methylobacterium sp. PvR107]|uniref:imidazole glycerol phosphate synthase subunit HisH n=1 Tax=Methylobacterium sp. PvR107 TaxID=2806597 RepID=UPI001AE34303|nr:imidazole glycerol phosphate synthase subunit HisH [Methylobacterium sp. PvR107]MBP1178520.1 glutamine amidotransferase [Methylobacterium sp. PvR107]